MTAEITEYRVTFQSSARSIVDPRGTIELTGRSFSDLCAEAKSMGYPRVVSGMHRQITEWRPVEYPWDEMTP